MSDNLQEIVERVKAGSYQEADIQAIAAAIESGQLVLASAPRAVGVGKDVTDSQVVTGNSNVTGDRNIVIYGADAQTIQAVVSQHSGLGQSAEVTSINLLVQEVRSRVRDDIQSLHGTMPLWGVDNWVPLGDLFVDVNILESLSSSRRSELDDLWHDFTTGNSNYRSLDRIGLGKERERVSGLAVLERNNNLMVVGKPGSGKTTYLQRIVTECNNGKLQAQRIPVLIKLREFIDDGCKYAYNLEQFLGQLWRLSNTDIELVLNRGLALVLLDGLDEVTGEAGKQIVKEIKRLARDYPQLQVVVTCRTQSQESRFERFDYVEVADFDKPQVRAFAEHWFRAVCADAKKALEFLEQLFREENQPIRELAITPILLSLICSVFHQTGKFYSKRSKLYQEGLELLLEKWDKSREVKRDEIYRDLSVERKLELLSFLAAKKFEQKQYVLFEQEELEGYIGEFLGSHRRDSQGVLMAIASQHGLLIERAQKVWSFSHLTFQEYLAAKCLLKYSQLQSLLNLITYKYLREVFILIVKMINNADNLLMQMKVKIDKVLASDRKCQRFLSWINRKSMLVNAPYKLAAIRAFYIKVNKCSNLLLSNDLAFAIDANLKHDCTGDYFQGNEFMIQTTFPSPPRTEFHLDESLDALLADGLESPPPLYTLIFLGSGVSTNDEFKNSLQSLCKQLPKHKISHDWWQEKGRLWVEQLRNLSIKYRLIGQDWQFSEEQKALLMQYFHANILLVDCLNSCCVVSDKVKEEIETTLLLPIAEIEKRQRENID